MHVITELLGIGLEPKQLNVAHVTLRAFVVFLVCLVQLRLADRRFMARLSALDVIVGFILASMLARAVNGSAPFLPTLVGGFAVVFLHRGLAWATCRWSAFGRIVNGRAILVIRDGDVNRAELRRNHISEDDLLEELREEGKVAGPADVKLAHLERNGRISVVKSG